MKKLIILLIVLPIAQLIIAQTTSTLIVFSDEGTPFYLTLNGIRQNDNPETNIRVEGLSQPYYSAKILFRDETMMPIEKKNLQVKDVEGGFSEVTYVLKRDKKGELKLKFYSMVPIAQAPPVAPAVTVVQYTTTPKPAVTTVSTTETTTTTTVGGANDNTENINVNVNMGGMNMGMNVNINDGTGTTQQTHSSSTTYTTTSTITETTNSVADEPKPVNEMPGYNGPIGCDGTPMAQNEFSEAKSSLSSKTFEDSKLTLAKQIANANCLTAAQVKETLQLFTYESSKLDFAKHAYSRTYDIGNYYKVNDSFEYESSIDELNEFIGK